MQPETDYAPDTRDRIDHSTEPGSAAGSVPGVQCSVCSSTFRRPEHLKRHLRSHTKEKPFECPQCGRHFSRTDTLHRHELSHHTQGSDGGKDRTHRITVKTFRACFGCAMARVRCSGGHPCGRCDTRSLECQYPTERRSKVKARNGSSRRLSITEGNELLPYEPHPDPALMEGTMSFQLTTQTPAHDTKDSQTTSVSNPQHSLLSSDQGSTILPMPMPPAVYQKDDCSQSYKGVIDTGRTSMYTTEPATGMSSRTKQSQADVLTTGGSGVDVDVDMSGNSNMELEFDRPFFEPSMSSTINWLPSEIFAPGDQTKRLGPPSQQSEPFISEAYAAHMASQLPVINTRQTNLSLPANVSQIPSKNVTLEANTDTPPIEHPHVVSEASLNTDSVHSEKLSANYYLDGSGARLPKYGKNQAFWTSSPGETPSSEKSFPGTCPRSFGFPTSCEIRAENVSTGILQSLKPIEASRYDEIHGKFLLLCRQETPFFEKFDSAHFPAVDECNGYILCFFDSFQTTYPMLHLSTFDPNQCHWLLALAVMAIGCHFSGTMEVDRCTTAFHEMIRRALVAEKKNWDCFKEHTLDLVQAMLLNCIGNLHSRYEDVQRFAMSSFSDLVTLSNNEGLLASGHSKNPIAELSDSSAGVQWSQWIESEVRKRTGYCIWLLDSTFAYYFEQRPLLSLDDGQAALPSHERLWQVNSAEAWKQQWVDSIVNESLYDAVHMLYIEKKLASGIGEFSHILLIHALYHRMWEVGDYFRRPLSFWSPTTKRQSCKTAIPTGSVWLPGIPSYSKWRNSACDCLDILHWTANSTIANAAGLEHPTVLHLHTARLILLAPFREIRSLATSLATGKAEWDQRSQELEWQYIWRWVKHDQYKARLSIIHAGVTLWHIRRYSTNAFHEPTAAFLAVLTLWAYGTCHVNGPQNSSPESETNQTDISNKPSFVHLDRPCDDELVQLFVREGHAMKGNVTGVGDICASDGPERILRMGCETLSCLKAWGISKRLIFILTQVADIMSRGHDTTSDIC